VRIRPHDEVLAVTRRSQIGGRGAPTAAFPCRALEVSCTFLSAVIEVIDRWQTGLDRGFHQAVRQFGSMRLIGDMQGTTDTMEFVGATFLVFCLFEVRQNAVPVPAGAAALPPFIVVRGIAAHIHHAIDRTRAAEYLAAWLIQRASIELPFRFALVHPVDARIGVHAGEAHRGMNPWIAILAAGFQQQHVMAPRLTEPCCDDAASGTCTRHDIVESIHIRGHRPPHGPLDPLIRFMRGPSQPFARRQSADCAAHPERLAE
jgi:hypothetical protein